MPTNSPADPADRRLEVTVYGLKNRDHVRRLIRALAAVPCFPLLIFSLDRLGRLLCVVEQQERGAVFYVRIRNWGRRIDRLPDIGWTSDPKKMGRGLEKRAAERLADYRSAVRSPGMVVTYSARDHFGACARM